MAKTILEHTVLVEQEEIPIVWRGDIIVAGGGPAGLGAAIAARRKGAKVMLLEQHGFLGACAPTGQGCRWGALTRGFGLSAGLRRRY